MAELGTSSDAVAHDAEAGPEDVAFDIQMMGGAVVELRVPPSGRVAELKQAFLAVKPCPPGKLVRLMRGPTILKDADPLLGLETTGIMAVFTVPEMSYLIQRDGGVCLVAEGDADFTEETAKKAQVGQEKWVPPHPDHAECRNLASVSEGASASASSIIWSKGLAAEEKLKNVLRLGSVHGDPRYMDGDNSFIFAENQQRQELTIDLGKDCVLVRIGTMCYGDRFLNRFAVRTWVDNEEEAVEWGDDRTSRSKPGVAFFDKEPTLVRKICMRCASGHYHGAGARVGPVFAYGWAAEKASEAPA